MPFVSAKDPRQPESLLFACDAFLKYEQSPFLTTAFESVVLQLLNRQKVMYGQLAGQGGTGLFLCPPGDGSEYAMFFPLFHLYIVPEK